MQPQNLHLIAHELCPYVQRSVITLEEKKIPYTRTNIDLAKKPAWFKRKSPMGKVPILLDENRALFESAVICEYLDEITLGSLHPADSFEKAYHRAWIEFGSGMLNSIAGLYNAKNITSFQNIHTEIQEKFSLVENEINGTSFFTGEEFHLIDAAYGPIFRYFDVFDSVIDLNIFEKLPKCQTWGKALMQRKSVQQAVSKDYPMLLKHFLINRDSYISQFISIEGG